MKPSAAIKHVVEKHPDPFLNKVYQLAQQTTQMSTVDALRSYGEKKQYGERTIYTGLSCGTHHGLPAVIRSVLIHEDDPDPTQAIIEEVNVGGNSNARSIALATLLYGYRGIQGFKVNEWIQGLKHKAEIEAALRKIQQQ